MKADAWGREAAGVCTHQWWPLSLVTDYRSLMLPQSPPQLVEMNHPSAFFCKPSITSDSSPQTPPTTTTTVLPHPPPQTRSYTLEEDATKYLIADELCWRISPRGHCPPRHVTSCSSTSLPFPSHSFPSFCTSSCASDSAPALFFVTFSSSSTALSPIFDLLVLQRPQSITTPGLCATAAYQSRWASPCPPSQSEQIIVDILKGPADEMAHCGGAICSAASASQQTLSFVCCPGSWEDRSAHGDKQASHL